MGSPPLTCHMCTSVPPNPRWCGTLPAAADHHARSMRDTSSPSFLSLYPQHQSPVYSSSIIFFPAWTLVTRRVSKKALFYWCYREGDAEVGPRNVGVPSWRDECGFFLLLKKKNVHIRRKYMSRKGKGGREQRKEGGKRRKEGGRERRGERAKTEREIDSHQVPAISQHLQVVTVVWQLLELLSVPIPCTPGRQATESWLWPC